MITLIYRLIRSSWLYFLAQVLITLPFWRSGFDKLFNFNDAMIEMVGDGLNPPAFFAALTIFTQLVGSFLVIFCKRWAWLGAGALGVFTILTIFLVHNFWMMSGAAYDAHLAVFYRHLNLVGGLMLSAIAAELHYGKSKQIFGSK